MIDKIKIFLNLYANDSTILFWVQDDPINYIYANVNDEPYATPNKIKNNERFNLYFDGCKVCYREYDI